MRAFLAFFLVLIITTPARAHEMRPAFLDMHEMEQDAFAVLWKVPAMGERRLALYLRLPENCKTQAEPVRTIENNAYLERSFVTCAGSLKGKEIVIDGLRGTLTDVLARIAYRNGTTEVARLTPEQPSMTVTGAQTVWQVASTYFHLGVQHILTGYDHLLFVLALILLIHDRWMLIKTISAFTVAHTITLGGATLGYFSLPQKPVEAAIALSIAFVASELLKIKPGERRLAEAHPWIVAFSFGLLHGFGFAGALKEVGLPQSDVPVALLTFNLGVEAGQLMFVATVLVLWRVLTSLVRVPLGLARTATVYAVGTIATLWLIERLAGFAT